MIHAKNFFLVGICALVLAVAIWIWSRPERGKTGEVSTRFRLLGPNDRIAVDGFDDPKVQGVACHISRAVTGGIKGGLGLAEDTSDASIACRQIGAIHITVICRMARPYSTSGAAFCSSNCTWCASLIVAGTYSYTCPIAIA